MGQIEKAFNLIVISFQGATRKHQSKTLNRGATRVIFLINLFLASLHLIKLDSKPLRTTIEINYLSL